MGRHHGWRLVGGEHPPPPFLIPQFIPLSAPGWVVVIPFGNPCVPVALVFDSNYLSVHGVVLMRSIGSWRNAMEINCTKMIFEIWQDCG